jgi:L-amino acid N-acyltransferase YncA
VAERDGVIGGWARISPYSSRPCYAGVGEGSIYVRVSERGRGLGSALATALVREAERAGYYKILGKLFADNDASRRLVARHGFREVGVHLRHGRLDGDWRDVLVVERLVGEAAG